MLLIATWINSITTITSGAFVEKLCILLEYLDSDIDIGTCFSLAVSLFFKSKSFASIWVLSTLDQVTTHVTKIQLFQKDFMCY